MYIKNINIQNFRNYEHLNIDFHRGINIIYGKNGQGKTNLLESIYVLGLTKSHRSFIDNDLIKKDAIYSKIVGKLKNSSLPTTLEIIINKKSKQLFIDETKIMRNSDYVSKMNVIIFYPDDLELIKGSPQERRRYLNLEISQLDSTYLILLNEFNKLLKMRNDYLKKMSNNEKYDINYFEIINNLYVEKALMIYKARLKFVERINDYCENIFLKIAELEKFHIEYNPQISFEKYSIEELKKIYLEKLKNILPAELKLKNSLIGPHRDDFNFFIDNINIKKYGSQGQQRMAVLATKLSEIEIFKKYKNTTPILLLDDVFSELDFKKKNNLLKYIKKNIQTIITTTDLSNIDKKIIYSSKLIEIDDGKIKKIVEVKEHEKHK